MKDQAWLRRSSLPPETLGAALAGPPARRPWSPALPADGSLPSSRCRGGDGAPGTLAEADTRDAKLRPHCQGQRPLQTRHFMQIQFLHGSSRQHVCLGQRFNKPDGNVSQFCPAQLCLPPLRREPSLSPAGEGVCGVVRNAGRPAAALSPCLDEEADVEAAESPPRACFSPTRLSEACGLAEAGCGLRTV